MGEAETTAIYVSGVARIYARRVKYEGLSMDKVPTKLKAQVEYAIEEGLV